VSRDGLVKARLGLPVALGDLREKHGTLQPREQRRAVFGQTYPKGRIDKASSMEYGGEASWQVKHGVLGNP
jgi:hypothetical protein